MKDRARADPRPGDRQAARGLPRVRPADLASTARPTTGVRLCCRRSGAGTCTPSTRSAGWPTTSSTSRQLVDRSCTRPPNRPLGAPFAEPGCVYGREAPRVRGVVPRGRAVRRQRTRCWPRWRTPSGPASIDPECFDRFFGAMAMDLTTSAYETWDDLCGYMEGSAAVIGEMMLPGPRAARSGGVQAGACARARLPADQLPPRRRRGPRPRPGLRAAGRPAAVRRRPGASGG